MLRIYDGEVFTVELGGCNMENLYRIISDNPDRGAMVFVFTKNGRTIGAGSLDDFMDNTVILKTFMLEDDFFAEARDYCMEHQVKNHTFFPVLNLEGECVWLLFYMENKVYNKTWSDGLKCEQFEKYDLLSPAAEIDDTLLKDYDAYVFLELEEYTNAIARFLLETWPERPVYFRDENAIQIFGQKIKHFHSGVYRELQKEKCMYITSDNKIHHHENLPECLMHRYSSLSVMYSLTWICKREHFGNLNTGKTVFIIDFVWEGKNGLIDIAKYTYIYYQIAKERGWDVVVEYSRKPNQYLDAEGENMWEYFFEPLSKMTLNEAYQSDLVIRASANNIKPIARLNPYWRYWMDAKEYFRFMRADRFNRETEAFVDGLIPAELKQEGCRVLGVIARGTDYREEANTAIGRNLEIPDLDKMLKKTNYIMSLWQCEYVFVATEDEEYFNMFREVFGERMLYVEQPRVYHDYSKGHIFVADLLNVTDGKTFGRTYLAVIASLSRCNVLISNMINGTFEAAKSLNDENYELCEVVTRTIIKE